MKDITQLKGLLSKMVEDKYDVDTDQMSINQLIELSSWLKSIAMERDEKMKGGQK